MTDEPDIDRILEAATGDCFWMPDDVEVVRRPEINYSHSPRPAYNRVFRVRAVGADIDRLVDEVLRVHEGTTSRWNVTSPGGSDELRATLRENGWTHRARHRACAVGVGDYDRTPPGDVEVDPVETLDGLRTLYRVQQNVFGEDLELEEDDLERDLHNCTGADRRVVRFLARRRGEPAGCGGLTVFEDLDFGLIWAGGVRKEHRGNGVYTALLATRARHARRRGLKWLGLYARQKTSLPIVRAHGFDVYGTMDYYLRQPE